MNNKYTIKTLFLITLSSLLVISCKDDDNTSDAFGNFDVDETIISAEAAGKLEKFDITEGSVVKVGQLVGIIDSTNLILERNSIEANKLTISA